jgi:hypothetical protein
MTRVLVTAASTDEGIRVAAASRRLIRRDGEVETDHRADTAFDVAHDVAAAVAVSASLPNARPLVDTAT